MLQNMYPGSLYASVADKEGYKQIKNIFIKTADNEKEHAKRFYKFLLEGFQNELPATLVYYITGKWKKNMVIKINIW